MPVKVQHNVAALLESAGFQYLPDRMLFVQRELRKAISVEAAQDLPQERIEEFVRTPTAPENPVGLLFSSTPPEGFAEVLARQLGWTE